MQYICKVNKAQNKKTKRHEKLNQLFHTTQRRRAVIAYRNVRRTSSIGSCILFLLTLIT
jgi:hypothetical protein